MVESEQLLEVMQQRIAALETECKLRDHKLNRMAIVLLLGLLAVVVAISYLYSKRIGIPSKLVTHSVVVADELGHERMWIGVNENGPGIGILAENGETRLWVGLNNGNPSVGLYGPDNKLRGSFGYGGERGFLFLFDNEGKKVFGQP